MTAIIEFGSRRHGCYDSFSDKDAYLLYGPNDNVVQEKDKLERQGYSVTTSTRERAEYLSAKGNLFVRHVFFEGAVIGGCEQDRVNIKNLWRSAPCYDREIEENVEMLGILEAVPSTIESMAAVNDIIICSLRNILIRKLANSGFFVFSWKDIIFESRKRKLISENDATVMYQARMYKNGYRLGLIPKVNERFLELLEEIMQKVIDRKRRIKLGSHKEVLASPEKVKEGSYSQLRAIELLCSHYRFHESMKKYSSLVKDPAYFSAFGSSKALQRQGAKCGFINTGGFGGRD